MDKASDAWDLRLFLNGRATAMVTFLTDTMIFFADLAPDEATDNIEGDEWDETPRGTMLNADLKFYSYSECLLYVGWTKPQEQLKF